MRLRKLLAVLSAICTTPAWSLTAHANQRQSVTPIQKVTQMLSDMLAKGKAEMQDEQVRFAEFKTFCQMTTKQKQAAIEESNEAIETLTAVVAKAKADAKILAKKIASTDEDLSTWEEDIKTARKNRKEEAATFKEAHSDYTNAVSSVERALSALESKKKGASFGQFTSVFASSLLQLSTSTRVTERQRRTLTTFLQRAKRGVAAQALIEEAMDEGLDVAPPEAKTYESSSGGIIEMIEKLGEKFEDERTALEKREANQQHAFEMFVKNLESTIADGKTEREKHVSTMQQRKKDGAQSKGELEATQQMLAEDEKFVNDLDAECMQKSFDFNGRQEVRQGEIDAISKAIEIMSGGAVAGGSEHLGLAQTVARTSLAQLRSTTRDGDRTDAVANFLAARAKETKSRILFLLSERAAADPFTKVKKMIQDMVVKLMEEANEEAEHKAFCDAEMGTNLQTREAKASQAESLQADMEELSADIEKLSEEITALSQQIVDIDAGVAKATAQRDDEKAKNAATAQDAKVAGEAVAQALEVLKDFYAKAAIPVAQPAPQQGPVNYDPRALAILKTGGASFVQTSSHTARRGAAPEMEEGGYTGMANGGVLGLLEVIQSDFSKLVSETTATEQEAVRIYEEFMADSDQDKAVKNTDMNHKKSARQGKESALADAKKDLRITQEELASAMKYYDELKPSCANQETSYADRVKQRNAEIESLKEALEILSGDNI